MVDENRSRAGWWSLTIAIAAGSLLPLAAWPHNPNALPARTTHETAPVGGISPWKERPDVIARDHFLPIAKYVARVRPGRNAKDSSTEGLKLKAIASGRSPQALIEINGETRIVSVGDSIGTVRVRAILSSGIELSDGSVLPLSL